jgi:hypothetical protein
MRRAFPAAGRMFDANQIRINLIDDLREMYDKLG